MMGIGVWGVEDGEKEGGKRRTTMCEKTMSRNFSSVATNSRNSCSPVKLMRIVKACSAIFYYVGKESVVSPASSSEMSCEEARNRLTGMSRTRSLRCLTGFSCSVLKMDGSDSEKGTRFSIATALIWGFGWAMKPTSYVCVSISLWILGFGIDVVRFWFDIPLLILSAW